MAKRRTRPERNKPSIEERVAAVVESYINECFVERPDPKQVIELKLAMYAGMAANAQLMVCLPEEFPGDDEGAAALDELFEVIHRRAKRLNEERSQP